MGNFMNWFGLNFALSEVIKGLETLPVISDLGLQELETEL